MPQYREISIHDLQNVLCREGAGVVARHILHAPRSIDLPAVSFGCSAADLSARGKTEAAESWGASRFRSAGVWCLTLGDAVMHGPYGVITVDGWAIRESFLHVFPAPGHRRQNGVVDLPDSRVAHIVARGWHAASGGYANYFHWMLNILPKLQIAPFADDIYTGCLMLPPQATRFARDTEALLAGSVGTLIHLAAGESARIGQLAFIGAGDGSAPHPCISTLFDRVAAACGALQQRPRRLYIARTGAKRRRLVNEAEVMALLRPLGYEVCDPASLSLREQAELFSSATHVVAPHGAGLANILFCRPGTVLLELMMDGYMNPCFRKLAALRTLRYGSVVGDAQTERKAGVSPHAAQWSIDTDRVRRAVEAADRDHVASGSM
jgi:capsular polysaccharide biosynthesis protein